MLLINRIRGCYVVVGHCYCLKSEGALRHSRYLVPWQLALAGTFILFAFGSEMVEFHGRSFLLILFKNPSAKRTKTKTKR